MMVAHLPRETATKLYLHYEGYPNYTYILHGTADDQRTAGQLRRQFVEAYNAHFGAALEAGGLRVLSDKRRTIDATSRVSKAFKAGSDIFIEIDPYQHDGAAVPGVAHQRPRSSAAANSGEATDPPFTSKAAAGSAPAASGCLLAKLPKCSSFCAPRQGAAASSGAPDFTASTSASPKASSTPAASRGQANSQAGRSARHSSAEQQALHSPLVGPFMERAKDCERRKHLRDAASIYEEASCRACFCLESLCHSHAHGGLKQGPGGVQTF